MEYLEKERELIELLIAKQDAEVAHYSSGFMKQEAKDGFWAEWNQARKRMDTLWNIGKIISAAQEEANIGCDDEKLLYIVKAILNQSATINYKADQNVVHVSVWSNIAHKLLAEFSVYRVRGVQSGSCLVNDLNISGEGDETAKQ